MRIMVTGAGGFIAKNLITELENRGFDELFLVTTATNEEKLYNYCREAQFVFHLAGSNRPQDEADLMAINYGFTKKLLKYLKDHGNSCPVVFASSTQAVLDNPYGRSKKAAEYLCFEHAKMTGAKVMIYRLPNVFGKWARPNYNSAVATFCHNLAHDQPIEISDRSVNLILLHTSDLVEEFMAAIEGQGHASGDYYTVSIEYKKRLGQIVDLLCSFKSGRKEKLIPDVGDPFTKKLYSTYISYLPMEDISYSLKTNIDQRGRFSEIFKTENGGQVSVILSNPGVVRGNHWHQTKHEKFIVIKGTGIIRLRKVGTNEISSFNISDKYFKVIDIPAGFTHNLENIGTEDMITLVWASENYDPNNPDTYNLEV